MVLQLYQIKYIFFIPAYAHLPAWIVVAGEQKSYLFLFLYVVEVLMPLHDILWDSLIFWLTFN